MVVSDIDLRLLRVFAAVVEAGGFANAQTDLNVSQSTISTQMAQLETRLGYSLCQRGRSGFRLTDKGQALYRHTQALFQSLHAFRVQAEELRGRLSGQLRIGFIDNIISDPTCPLQDALSRFTALPDNAVRLSVEVLSPPELEKGVLDQSLDAAVGIFLEPLGGLEYRPLHCETDILVCHRDHAFAALESPGGLAEALPGAPKVARTFLGQKEFPRTVSNGDALTATVSSLEAAATLILTGAYVGFLPEHYAAPWLRDGRLVALWPNRFRRYSRFHLVTRPEPRDISGALSAFLDCLDAPDERVSRTPAGRSASLQGDGSER